MHSEKRLETGSSCCCDHEAASDASGTGSVTWVGQLGVKEDHSEVLFVGSSVFPSCWRQESSLAFRCSKQTARPVEVQTWDQLSLGHLPQADHTGLRLTDGKLA